HALLAAPARCRAFWNAARPPCAIHSEPMTFFFFLSIRRPLQSTLFPYTTLFRSLHLNVVNLHAERNLSQRQTVTDFWLGFVAVRSEEHTSELQSRFDTVCRLLLEKKKPARTGRGRSNTWPNSRSAITASAPRWAA